MHVSSPSELQRLRARRRHQESKPLRRPLVHALDPPRERVRPRQLIIRPRIRHQRLRQAHEPQENHRHQDLAQRAAPQHPLRLQQVIFPHQRAKLSPPSVFVAARARASSSVPPSRRARRARSRRDRRASRAVAKVKRRVVSRRLRPRRVARAPHDRSTARVARRVAHRVARRVAHRVAVRRRRRRRRSRAPTRCRRARRTRAVRLRTVATAVRDGAFSAHNARPETRARAHGIF